MATRPDLSGRVVVVTGGNSGIGRESCLALAGMGATVVLGARDVAKGEAAVAHVRRMTGAGERVQLGLVDLASFRSIHDFAAEVLDRHDRIDVLLNNAGLILDHRLFTDEGYEMTFGVNHLGHFLLTDLLRERLVASAPARVVTVASIAHRLVGGRLERYDPQSEAGYAGFDVYCRSKLANVLFTRELARRLDGTGVTATCLHPGMIRSGFGRQGDHTIIDVLVGALGWLVLASPRAGARTSIHLASSPKVAGQSGAYYAHRRRHRASAAGRDDGSAAWLWAESERLVAEGERRLADRDARS